MQDGSVHFFTLGYQGRNIRSTVRLLKENRIDLLVDVRQNPVSRKAGFSKSRLEAELEGARIEYVHYPCLGTPTRIRSRYRSNGNALAALQAYARYLNTKGRCLRSLLDLASSKRFCLLCLERDHNLCHRGVIAAKLTEMIQCRPIHLT